MTWRDARYDRNLCSRKQEASIKVQNRLGSGVPRVMTEIR